MHCLRKIMQEEGGYGSIELLILAAASLAIAIGVCRGLFPALEALDGLAVNRIKEIAESGY